MKAISGLSILIFSRFCKLIWDDVERNIKVFTLWQDWLLLAYEIDDLFNPSFLIYFNNSNTFMVNLPIVKIRCFFSGLLKWLLITREDYSLWQETGERGSSSSASARVIMTSSLLLHSEAGAKFFYLNLCFKF